MPSVQLTQQGAALLKEVQRKVGLFELGVDQTLQQAQTTQVDPAAPLGLEQVEKLLLQAMPSQAQVIQTASSFAKGYHPDNKNPRFLTQILSMRIEKEHDFGVGATTPPRGRDPLYASFTLDLLSQHVSLSAGANPNGNDRSATSKSAVDLIYGATRDKITVGANKLSPLADVTIKTAEMAANKIALTAEPIADPNNDAVKIQLKLDDAFLGVADGASVKGWKMSVGFQDASGKWVSVGERGVKTGASKAESFPFDVDDFDALQQKDQKLEVRLFNAEGVPAQRVILPFRDVSWAD